MTDDDLLRYSRHILLDEIGIEGQGRLLAAHALVIGAGGLGSPVALYLGTAGVGRITLVDHDTVDLTNLQRQIAHTLARVGQPKVESARAGMLAINPTLDIRTVAQRADARRKTSWRSSSRSASPRAKRRTRDEPTPGPTPVIRARGC